MKALTLHQPWASLVAIGAKTIETRSWRTSYRGPLAMHAAKRSPTWDDKKVGDFHLRAFGRASYALEGPGLPAFRSTPRLEGYMVPFGKIVATCTLVDVLPIHEQGCKCQRIEGLLLLRWTSQFGEGAGLFDADGAAADHPRWPPSWSDSLAPQNPRQQVPYGDYRCGRFAWLLDDIKPTTERCPACLPDEHGYVQTDPTHRVPLRFVTETERCSVCAGEGRCAAVPAVGRQQLWEWTP